MSCLSSLDDVDGRRGESAAERPALDMLDEYWFFSNTLGKQDAGRGRRRPPLLPKSPSTSSSGKEGHHHGGGKGDGSVDDGAAGKSRFYASGCRRLLRTPSRHVGMEEELAKDEEIAEEAAGGGADEEVEVEDDDMNWSSIYEGILRTRITGEGGGRSSALHRAPSMPVPSSATMGYGGGRREEAAAATTKSTPSMPRLRHSYSTLERHCRSHTPTKAYRTPTTSGGGVQRGQTRRELRSFSASQQPAMVRQTSALIEDKKWKSSSSLESIEVQGFKDLGFVFDQDDLRESLADVLPGLRDSKTNPQKSSGSGSGSGSASDNEDANRNGIGIGNASSDVGDGTVRRPYLSEAWHHGARSAPSAATPAGGAAIRLQQADARSAAEMKDQIRMWAQAVACNVRQEC